MKTKEKILAPHNVHRVIPQVSTKYGVPMGRNNKGTKPKTGTIYDKQVPLCSCCGAYDKGGAYWGIGKELRVMFTPDLNYIEFYRAK